MGKWVDILRPTDRVGDTKVILTRKRVKGRGGWPGLMAYNVVEIQPTPNPNALKFLLDRQIAQSPTSFLSAEAAADHPIARRLFAVPGVSSILLLGDFVTVNKSPDASWADIKSRVRRVLSEL